MGPYAPKIALRTSFPLTCFVAVLLCCTPAIAEATANDPIACVRAALRVFRPSPKVYRSSGKPESWDLDGRYPAKSSAYDRAFAPFLGTTLDNYARVRALSGKTTHVADLFGSAVFSHDPSAFSSLTGVRLHPLKSEAVPTEYKTGGNHWAEVIGNLLLPDTWARMQADRSARGIPAYDLILVKPEGALEETALWDIVNGPDSLERRAAFASHLRFLSRAYATLSPDGIMLVQVLSGHAGDPLFQEWLRHLNSLGIEARTYREDPANPYNSRTYLVLKRNPESPSALPGL